MNTSVSGGRRAIRQVLPVIIIRTLIAGAR